MGQALLRGLIAQGCARRQLLVSEASASTRRQLRRLRVRVVAENRVAASQADILVLAVKPQDMSGVLVEIAWSTRPRQLVISIAAGTTLHFLQSRLRGVPIVRVMPNLGATRRQGFAAFSLGRHATASHRAITHALFGAVGTSVEVPERQLDAVTAVSGSGPAYVFFLAHSLETAAKQLGLPRQIAEQAVRQTLVGSANLLRHGTLSPKEWIKRVASKGGTTEAALNVLARRRVAGAFAEAVRDAASRSRQLATW